MTAGAHRCPPPAPWQLHWAYKIRSGTGATCAIRRQVCTISSPDTMILNLADLLVQMFTCQRGKESLDTICLRIV